MVIELIAAAAAALSAGANVEPVPSQEVRWTLCYVTAIRGVDSYVIIKTSEMPEGNNFAGKAARYRTWIETVQGPSLGVHRVTAAACLAPSAEGVYSEMAAVEERFLRQNSGALVLQPGDTPFRQAEAAIP